MSCSSCNQPSPFTIFQGNAKIMNLKALYAVTDDPLDLTSCTEIDIAIPKSDGTYLHLLKSASQVTVTSPAVLGKFTAGIAAEDSVDLNPGEFQNFNVTFTIGSLIFTVPYLAALSVFESDA